MMPCFYFDTYDGERFVPDDKGCDLAEFEEAKAGAVKALTDIGQDGLLGRGRSRVRGRCPGEGRDTVLRARPDPVVKSVPDPH